LESKTSNGLQNEDSTGTMAGFDFGDVLIDCKTSVITQRNNQ